MNIETRNIDSKVYKQFYSEFMFMNPEDFDIKYVVYICTDKRDKKLNGYPDPLAFCLLKTEKSTLISFSPKVKGKGMKFVGLVDNNMNIGSLKKLASDIFGEDPNHNIKFEYKQFENNDVKNAVRLNASDYFIYESFFKKIHPNAKIIDEEGNWLKKYFQGLAEKELCFGIVVDGELVSVTDSPTIPFMSDKLAMIGINTLPEYRQKGYAKTVVSAMIASIVKQGKFPLWSCAEGNIGSVKTALSVGFEKFGDMISIT